jgi:hypothetical protein
MIGPSILAANPADAAPAPLAAGDFNEVRLYLHSNNELTAASNSRQGPGSLSGTRTWTMPQGLTKNSCIEAGAPSSGASAFSVFLNVTYGPSSSDWNIRVSVKDESTVIAERVETIASGIGGRQTDWSLPFTANRTGCQIARNHRLAVEFTVDRASAIDNIAGAHLQLFVQDVIAPTAATYRGSVAADLFYPNDADAGRQVTVKGLLNNAFSSALISAVRIQFLNPSGVSQANVTATLNDQNFTYTWAYPVGQPAGSFRVEVTVEDVQGGTYTTSATFTMAGYGLRIDTAGQVNGSATRTTTEGVAAIYELTVTNIGGSPTTAQVVVQSPPGSGWSTEFIPGGDLTLEAGQGKPLSFRVIPSASIGPGVSTQVTIVARALNDPAAIKAQAVLATTTIVVERTSIQISPMRTDATIKLGESKRYDFDIINNGGLTTDILFNATLPPAGWDRTLEGPNLVPNGAGWRLVGVATGVPVTLTLVVFAPPNSTSNAVFDCVVLASAEQDPSAQATFTGSTILLLGIELTQLTFPPPAAPGAPPIEFRVDARNTDPLNRHTIDPLRVTLTEASNNPQAIESQPGGQITVFTPGGCCNAGQSITITVNVQLPTRALQGRYTLSLRAEIDGDDTQVAEINLTLNVSAVVAFQLVADPPVDALTVGEGFVEIPLTVVSESNGQLVVDMRGEVRGARQGEFWTIEFLDAGGVELDNGRVNLAPYGTAQVTVRIKAPNSVLNGDKRELVLRLDRAGGGTTAELSPHPSVTVELPPLTRLTRFATDPLNGLLLVMFGLWGLLCIRWAFSIRARMSGKAPPRPRRPPQGGKPPAERAKPPRPIK